MKKKIGSSKSMKKMQAGGQNISDSTKNTIPSRSRAKVLFDDYMKKKDSKPGPKYDMTNPTSKPKYEVQNPSGPVKYDKYKKGGSVSKMKMGGAVKKSSKKK